MLRNYLFCLFLFAGKALLADAIELKNIKEVVDSVLALHVEQKKIDTHVAKRALKVYLHRFDPYHSYLLESEAKPYLDPKDSLVQQIVDEYEKNRFDTFLTVTKQAHQAVLRARTVRSLIRTKLLKEREGDDKAIYFGKSGYAKEAKELNSRIEKQMRLWLFAYGAKQKTPKLDAETRLRVLNHYEKKRRALEDAYLIFSEEAPLHIAKALAAALDSHTMIYSQQEANDIRLGLHKQLFGVGLYLREEVEGPIVSGFVPNSPAERSKQIQIGDMLTHVDGDPTEGLSFKEVLKKLDGINQTPIELAFSCKAQNPKKLRLIREQITLESERLQVSSEPFLDGVIGKITLSTFYDNRKDIQVDKDLKDAIQALKQEGTLYGLIIDMRHNHGGFLHQAIRVSSLFIQNGVIVVAKYADEEIRYAREIDPRTPFIGPIVLLTSKASASAAEVVAQTLKDFGSAVIVGDDQTYGKGSMQVQTITDPIAKYYFKVTVGRYYTASGTSTQLKGVSSDIPIATEYAPYELGERYLLFPLAADHIRYRRDLKKDLKNVFHQYQTRVCTKWEHMIPRLKKNSRERLAEDKNYQAFIQYIYECRKNPFGNVEKEYGIGDLQMKEALNVIKDMVYLSQIPKV